MWYLQISFQCARRYPLHYLCPQCIIYISEFPLFSWNFWRMCWSLEAEFTSSSPLWFKLSTGPLPVWFARLALYTSPALAHTQDGCLTSLAFRPYHLIPLHPSAAIKPDPAMHMDQCCSSWFPLLLCLWQKKEFSLLNKLTIRPADYSPFLMMIRKLPCTFAVDTCTMKCAYL